MVDWPLFVFHATAADRRVIFAAWDRLEVRNRPRERRAKIARFSRRFWWKAAGGTGRADAPLFAPTRTPRA
jgi:hypothetical protein